MLERRTRERSAQKRVVYIDKIDAKNGWEEGSSGDSKAINIPSNLSIDRTTYLLHTHSAELMASLDRLVDALPKNKAS